VADLTTRAAVKAYKGITSTDLDALLDALITRASATIENFLQGSVLSASYDEVRDGAGGQAMMLAEYPVTAVTSLSIDGAAIPAAPAFGQAGWWLSGRTLLLVGYRYTRGRSNVLVTYTAGFAATPPDIEQACIETVVLSLNRRDHMDVSSKSLAGETVSFITTELTPSAKQILNSYRRVAPL
jgi:hypothetical protein